MLSAIAKGRDTGSEMVRCPVFLSYGELRPYMTKTANHIVEKAYFCYNRDNWGNGAAGCE